MAEKLIKLHVNHPKIYEFLNALVDILVKGVPFFIFFLFTADSSTWIKGENALMGIFAVFLNIVKVFLIYLMGIAAYLFLLLVVQIIKLFACTYKIVIIHIRIFDLIIKSQAKKIKSGTDERLRYMYYQHMDMLLARKERTEACRDQAEQWQYESDMQKLEYAQKEYEKNKDHAEWLKDSAQSRYESAKRGDGLFTSAADKRKQARKDLENASYYERDADYEKERIEKLKRKLGK